MNACILTASAIVDTDQHLPSATQIRKGCNQSMIKLNPKVLLHSKWTAAHPLNNEKHFMVTQLLMDEHDPQTPIKFIEIEAVYSGRKIRISPDELNDADTWLQGWR